MRKKIPAEDHRRKARPCVSSTPNRLLVGHTLIDECLNMRCRRVCLPERHDVHRILKLAAEDAGMNGRRQYFARFNTQREKTIVRAVAANAVAEIHKRRILPALLLANLIDRRIYIERYSVGRPA